jgi:putative peptidoglycan lipid II flippase
MPLARDVTTVGSATLLSRLLGFIRDAGVAGVLGAGALSDAFFAAMQLPNLVRRLLAEGALNAAFVPMWLARREADGAAARRFACEVLGLTLAAAIVVVLAAVLFAPAIVMIVAPGFAAEAARFALAVHFVEIVTPYLALAAPVAVAAAVLNAEGKVAAVSFGLVIFNVVLVFAVLLVVVLDLAETRSAGTVLAASVVAAGVAQLIVVGRALSRLPDPPLRPRFAPSAETLRFLGRAAPGVIAAGAPQLVLIAASMVASASPSAVSWLYYANRLYELPLGVAATMVAAVMVPRIAAGVRRGASDDAAAAQSRAFEIATGLALPAAVALVLLAVPIAGTLFERGAFGPRDTAAVAAALAIIAMGLPGHVLEKVLGAVAFAHDDTRTPMWAALAGVCAGAVGAIMLYPSHGHVGIAAAIAIAGWVGAAALALPLARRGWLHVDAQLVRRLPRIALATIAMGAVLHLLLGLLAPWIGSPSSLLRIVSLAALVLAGLAVYVALLQALGVARLADLIAAIRHRP